MAGADNRHVPIVELDDAGNVTRIVGCRCGWKMPAHVQDTDTVWCMHSVASQAFAFLVSAFKPYN